MLVGKITKTLGQETKFIRNVLIKNNDEFTKNATKPLKNTFKKEKQHVRQSQGGDDVDDDSAKLTPCSKINKFSTSYSSNSKSTRTGSRVNSLITYFKIYNEMENYDDFKELVDDLSKRDFILEKMYQESVENEQNIQPLVIPVSFYKDYFKINPKWNVGKNEKLLFDDIKQTNIIPISVNEEFQKHFNLYSDSMFIELNWDNICIIGDSVYNCFICIKTGTKLANYYFNLTSSSIDFYMYGLNFDQAKYIYIIYNCREKIKYMILYITTFCKQNSCKFEILQSNSILSIISDNYRRINIICKSFASFESLLYLYPVDCARLLYDGEDIYCTPKTHLSLMCGINIYNWNFHSSSYIYELYYYGKKGYMIYLNKYKPKLKNVFEENNQLDKLYFLDQLDNNDTLKKSYKGLEDLCFSDSLLYNHNIPWGIAVSAKDVHKYLDELYKEKFTSSDGCSNNYNVIKNGEDLMKFVNCLDWCNFELINADCDPKVVFSRRRLSSQVFC